MNMDNRKFTDMTVSNRHTLNNGKRGFTLVELIIVIAVIAVLAAVLVPTISNVTKDAREAAILQNGKQRAQTCAIAATQHNTNHKDGTSCTSLSDCESLKGFLEPDAVVVEVDGEPDAETISAAVGNTYYILKTNPSVVYVVFDYKGKMYYYSGGIATNVEDLE